MVSIAAKLASGSNNCDAVVTWSFVTNHSCTEYALLSSSHTKYGLNCRIWELQRAKFASHFMTLFTI